MRVRGMIMAEFAGFKSDTMKFLTELAVNNNRDWFAENKHRYESSVVDPAFAFIIAMGAELAKISDHFEAIPKKQGGSLMRVYRDTRFSKDKTPYKTNIGIQFRHEAGRDVHAPGYYMHIDPKDVFVGAGLWRPEPAALAGIRERITDKSDDWKKIVGRRGFKSTFERQGESLVRPPKGFVPDSPVIEELKRKDHIAVMSLSLKDIADKNFPSTLRKQLDKASPFMEFLCKAVGVPF